MPLKKRWVFYTVTLAVLALIGTRHYILLRYDMGLLRYLELRQPYTEQEHAVLAQYGDLIYGGNINEPPLGQYYAENGQYLGLVVDHISALSIELGSDIIAQPMVWEQALEALARGETNLCDMIPSPERAEVYAFTDPIYTLEGGVITRKEDEARVRANTWGDLRVAVARADYILTHALERVQMDQIYFTNDIAESLALLEQGEVDAVVGDTPVLRYYLNALAYRDRYVLSVQSLYSDGCVIAVPKAHQDLIPVLNKAILHLKQSGTIEKINNKWLENEPLLAKQRARIIQLVLLYLMLGALFLLLMTALWNRHLMRIVADKTEEIRAKEAALTHENKMAAIGQLSSGIAHELRNPLGIIRNASFLLKDGWNEEELREMALTSINSSIERASAIIDHLLRFARYDADGTEHILLAPLVSEVLSFFRTEQSNHHIALEQEIPSDLALTTNPSSLRHILLNLIQNAADAIPEEGTILIRAESIANTTILEVSDDGAGISPAHLARIFEPFYTTKEVGKGTGLGLYIVYTETQKLGGTIAVHSASGKTVFTLTLPDQKEVRS